MVVVYTHGGSATLHKEEFVFEWVRQYPQLSQEAAAKMFDYIVAGSDWSLENDENGHCEVLRILARSTRVIQVTKYAKRKRFTKGKKTIVLNDVYGGVQYKVRWANPISLEENDMDGWVNARDMSCDQLLSRTMYMNPKIMISGDEMFREEDARM